MVQLQPDDAGLTADLLALLLAAGHTAIEQNGVILIPFDASADTNADEARILTRLREAGYTPHLATRPQ
jgi:hypothetical protein